MEKHHGKSGSFIGRWRTNIEHHDSPRSTFSPKMQQKCPVVVDRDHESTDDVDESLANLDHDQISIEIDRFADALHTADDKSTPPEVPETVETFSKIIESMIKRYRTTKSATRFGEMTDEDKFFIEAVRRLSKLKNSLGEFPHTSSLDRTGKVLQRAMVFMEDELHALLEDSRAPEPIKKAMPVKHSSFKSDRCPIPEPKKEEEFPGYTEENTIRMNKIVTTMISAGHENECCNVYSVARKNALNEQINRFEFEKFNVDYVQKSNWDSLQEDVSQWIKTVKHYSDVVLTAEQKLGETVFSDHLPVFRGLFVDLIRSGITPILDFTAAVATTKRSAEKLFKFLDIYEVLRELGVAIKDSISGDYNKDEQSLDLNSEITSASDRICDGVMNTFDDLENSIRNDVAKIPVPGGAVHPLTRYVMNYLRYACEYTETLEQIFKQSSPEDKEKSTLSSRLSSVMTLLDGNLESKSTLYRNLSLRYIFLMNNGRYILQKVKGSTTIRQLMGDNWCRRKSSEVRQYHKSYQRETWTRLLQCITQEGIQVNGKVNRQVLKDKFKNFNAMFDEIHKTQSTWIVNDEQLVSELRVSISAVVTPAYRSFVGRYKHHLEGGRHMEKLIKHQPEDIEALIETLFEGNPLSMTRKKP